MRGGRITTIALALSGAVTANAQQLDVATDNELQAAYCIGALQGARPTALEEAIIQRFRAYLAARGAFTIYRGRMASQGLNIAVERGHADGVVCNRKQESCTNRCLATAKGTKDEAESCGVSCEAVACEGPDRCRSHDIAMPF